MADARGARRCWRRWCAVVAVGALAGCGGGGGGGGASAGGVDGGAGFGGAFLDPLAGLVPTGASTEFRQTARFAVDVESGKVTVDQPEGRAASRAVLSGTVVNFSSSVLFDQPGDSGLKVLRVSLRNQSGLTIGHTADGAVTGLRVFFSTPRSLEGAELDLRDRCTVSSWAGSGAASGADGAADQAGLQGSIAVANGDGSVQFISDFVANRLRQRRDGTVNTIAISESSGGAPVPFNHPFGLAYNRVDQSLWVCDAGGHRVRRVTLDGLSSTICGDGTANSVDGPGNAARCNNPVGITVSPDGVVYFTEGSGSRVRRIVYNGGGGNDQRRLASNYQVSTVAGSGVAGIADGTSNTVMFNYPIGIAWGDGQLYIADTGNRRIRRVSVSGETVTIAGTGASGSGDGYGDVATFDSPVGLCWTTRGLVIADRGAHVIRLCSLRNDGAPTSSPTSWVVRRLAGNGTPGITDGTSNTVQFNQPYGVTEDGAGNLYVADYGNHRIRRITLDLGNFTLGQPGNDGGTEQVRLTNADGIAPSTGFGDETPFRLYPEALANGATSQEKDWWFSVPSGVRAFDFEVIVAAATDGPATPPAGTANLGSSYAYVRTLAGHAGQGAVDGTLAQARFGELLGLDVDAAGNVFVIDRQHHSVRRIGTNGRVSTVVGIRGLSGSTNGTGDVASLDQPGDLAVSPDGQEIFVTELNGHRVRRIALSAYGDPTRSAQWLVSTVAGTGVSPDASPETNGLGNVATLEGPQGICRDSSGTLYVTELYGHRVRRIQFLGGDPTLAASYVVTTVAGSGNQGTADGSGVDATFTLPYGIGIDGVGNLYVSDNAGTANGSIRKISPHGQVVTLANALSYPRGVAVDSAGFIYVIETGANILTRLSADGSTRRVVAGLDSVGGGPANGTGNVARLLNASALAIDITGNLYFTDGQNGASQVRVIERVIDVGRPGEPVSQDF